MKTVKICFVDFYPGFNEKENDFIDILTEKYNVVIDSSNPDAIFYSCFGNRHVLYDCTRIFYTGECVTPDFNVCDYAIGFDRLSLGDRYIRVPLYLMFQYKEFYNKLFERSRIDCIDAEMDFCSLVCSNCFADDKRAIMFKLLSKYKKINSGGRYLNNVGGPISDKLEFQKKHKFSIAFENGSYSGYATEKLVDSLAARTIPIYFGDPEIHLDFNENSFINGHRYNSLEEIVERVKEIDSDNVTYLNVINENPILVDNRGNRDLKQFLYNIFDQDRELAKRRPESRYSREYESFIKRHRIFEDVFYSKYIRVKKIIYRLTQNAL